VGFKGFRVRSPASAFEGRDGTGLLMLGRFRLCCSGGADGGEEPAAGREGGHGAVGHQLRRPLHLVHGRLLPRQVRRLAPDGKQRLVRDAVAEHREPQPPADNVTTK